MLIQTDIQYDASLYEGTRDSGLRNKDYSRVEDKRMQEFRKNRKCPGYEKIKSIRRQKEQ